MTPTEDREIDALIAEKVFGLMPCDNWRGGNLGSAGGPVMLWPDPDCKDHPQRGKELSCYPRNVPFWDGNGCPRYSTNAADSKVLRDRLAELGYAWRLEHPRRWVDGVKVDVTEFGIWKDDARNVIYAEADTEFRAVALCALKAVGVEL